jgi:ATP-dependent exoDNAse (exonuclease V) alpha subunit
VQLCKGMPVIARKSDKKNDICNNQTFVIAKVSNETIFLKSDDDEIIDIKTEKFQEYFYPAFYITIHKSQGQTFDFEYTICEWNKTNFDSRLKYVALSRATHIKNINIIN